MKRAQNFILSHPSKNQEEESPPGRRPSDTDQEFIKTLAPHNQACRRMAENNTNGSAAATSSSPITRIPRDHLFSILLLLPVESILCFAMTCKKLRALACSDSLWESIYRRDWGQIPPEFSNRPLPWKKLYQQVYQLDSVYCRSLLSDSPAAILPTPRASHSLNLVSGCLLLFGGGCDGGKHLDDTWAAWIGGPSSSLRTTLTWQRTNSGIPSGRFGHSCVVIDDYVVMFGGINDQGVRQNDTWIGQVTVHERLGITLSWRLLDVDSTTPAPPPRGAHAGCCIDNRRMLIHGGIGPPGVRLGDTWVLDLSEDLYFGTWREIVTQASCPPCRSGHTLTHIGGGQTILFGGRDMGYDVLNDVWILNASSPCEGNWKWGQLHFDLHSIPQGLSLPRVGHSASLIIGRRLLIYGGEDSHRHRKDDFWVLDVSRSTRNLMESRKLWRRVESRGQNPGCRSFHGACVDVTGRYLYVYGGMIDGPVQPGDSSGLRFDGESFVVELVVRQPESMEA